MNFNPKRRYSAVAVMSEDLERVVLIHKLRPDWQAGKANLPGGKVDGVMTGSGDHGTGDWPDRIVQHFMKPGFRFRDDNELVDQAHLVCAARELREETSLDVAAAALQLFCRLRFKSREGDDAECCFYAVKGDVDAARTRETERVFTCDIDTFFFDGQAFYLRSDAELAQAEAEFGVKRGCWLPTMPNLPYLVAMARQCLRGEGAGSWPLTVYENGATA